MKRFQRLLVFFLAAAMVLTLCGCSEKAKPEKINTKDYSREIQIEAVNGDVEVLHADKSSEAGAEGLLLKSDDSLRIPSGGDVTLSADGDKYIYGQEDSALRLEASGTPDSGKTRICLEEGSVLVRLDEPLEQGELFEVQTDASTVSIPGGIVRVSEMAGQDGSFILVEAFQGEAQVVIRKSGEKAEVKAGEAVLINESAKKPAFVHSDEIDQDFWKSDKISGFVAGKDGTGSVTLSIPYSKLPASVAEQLRQAAEDGKELSVSEKTLTNLIETGHDFVETVVKEATCEEDGLLSLECSLCGEMREASIPALGHQEVEDAAVEATCTQDGKTAGAHCAVCGEILTEQEVIPALGHQEVEDAAVEASCTQDGKTAGSHCAVCGEILTGQKVVPALGHQEQKGEDTPATCLEGGFNSEVRCSVCGEVLREAADIPALGHQPEELPAVKATCVKDGLSAGSRCALCGEILTEQEKIPALGHDCEVIPGREPTCVRSGLTDGQRCKVCGRLVEARKTIPMLSHTPKTVPSEEATCEKEGYTESVICGECGHVLTPAETIPMLEHTVEVMPSREPTCTQSGLTEGSRCSVCGKILVPQEEIPALGHVVEIIPGKEATCSSLGSTEGQRCQVCKKVLVWPTVIPKPAHTPQKVYGVYPMCFREGKTDGVVCSVCGYEIEPCQVIPKLPHTPGGLAAIAPTCTTPGWTEGVACQVCSEILVPQQKIPAAHKEGSTIKIENTELPVLDAEGNMLHDENHHPWCYQIAHVCSVCGEIYQVDYFDHIPGAEETEMIGTADACIQSTVKCALCGKVIQRHITGHTGEMAVSEPDENGDIWETETCTTCGLVLRHEKKTT